MGRPGIMLYFDILDPIKVLSDADKGRLLVAMLEYGKDGVVPDFDGMLAMAWGFIRPKLDRDEESYDNSKVQRQYAAFCKRRKGLNLPKIPIEEWLQMDPDERKRRSTTDNEPLRPVDSVDFRYPSTSTTAAASTPTSTPSSATAAAFIPTGDATAATESAVGVMGGELGKGVVVLSEEQIADLLDRLGLDVFNHYVDTLSSFIIRNGANVKDHYGTILKWWREDSRKERG